MDYYISFMSIAGVFLFTKAEIQEQIRYQQERLQKGWYKLITKHFIVATSMAQLLYMLKFCNMKFSLLGNQI